MMLKVLIMTLLDDDTMMLLDHDASNLDHDAS